jgi:hypothetical protein
MTPYKLKYNQKGFVLSIDLHFGLILIILILGISANTLSHQTEKISTTEHTYAIEHQTIETTDILLETPGTPINWETTNDQSVIPGLKNPNQNTISWNKIQKLKENSYTLLPKIYKNKQKTKITITPQDKRINPIIINNKNHNTAKEVVTVNRTCTCDFLSEYNILEITWNKETLETIYPLQENSSTICHYDGITTKYNHNTNQASAPQNRWVCRQFQVNPEDIPNNNYYILSEGSTSSFKWIIDTSAQAYNATTNLQNNAVNINSKIKASITAGNTTTVWLHLYGPKTSNTKVYLVKVPKNTNSKYIKPEYFKKQTCNIFIENWI